jgi:hypothetical protein
MQEIPQVKEDCISNPQIERSVFSSDFGVMQQASIKLLLMRVKVLISQGWK